MGSLILRRLKGLAWWNQPASTRVETTKQISCKTISCRMQASWCLDVLFVTLLTSRSNTPKQKVPKHLFLEHHPPNTDFRAQWVQGHWVRAFLLLSSTLKVQSLGQNSLYPKPTGCSVRSLDFDQVGPISTTQVCKCFYLVLCFQKSCKEACLIIKECISYKGKFQSCYVAWIRLALHLQYSASSSISPTPNGFSCYRSDY